MKTSDVATILAAIRRQARSGSCSVTHNWRRVFDVEKDEKGILWICYRHGQWYSVDEVEIEEKPAKKAVCQPQRKL